MPDQVMPGIYRIPIKLPKNPLKEINSYLIMDNKNPLLIDTGFNMPECKDDLLFGLKQLNVSTKDLDIFVTHRHNDHCGLAVEIIDESRKIYLHEIERKALDLPNVIEVRKKNMVAGFITAGFTDDDIEIFIKESPVIRFSPKTGSASYVSIKEGDVFKRGEYEFECILTPGHTPGHVCLWDEKHKLMLCGDHVLFDITPNITSWTDELDDALGTYFTSLEKISKYPVEIALPSHRKSGDFHNRIKEILSHHKARLDEVIKAVNDSPGSCAVQIAKKLTWRIRANSWEDFPAPQKIFAVGETVSHLDHLVISKTIRKEFRDGVYHYYPA